MSLRHVAIFMSSAPTMKTSYVVTFLPVKTFEDISVLIAFYAFLTSLDHDFYHFLPYCNVFSVWCTLSMNKYLLLLVWDLGWKSSTLERRGYRSLVKFDRTKLYAVGLDNFPVAAYFICSGCQNQLQPFAGRRRGTERGLYEGLPFGVSVFLF